MSRHTAPMLATLFAAAAVAATACTPLAAQPLVDVDVIDRDSGEWLPEYVRRGQTWIPGTPGHRYSVRLTNTTGERVLVVLSVDGVNAISGETASTSQTGYVLGPWQTTEIAGWRKSMRDVARFYFTDLPDSYAARTGRPENVGVIGVAVFRERTYPRPYDPPVIGAGEDDGYGRREDRRENPRYRDGAPAGKAAPAAPQASRRAAEAVADSASGAVGPSLGTGHGEREWSPVGHTDFVRASRTPGQVIQLRYDDVPNLIAMGVLPRDPYDDRRRHRGPQAFPNGFVADPPRW